MKIEYKYRVTTSQEYVWINDHYDVMYCFTIQVKGTMFWHDVTCVVDTDKEYCENRSAEIVELLMNA